MPAMSSAVSEAKMTPPTFAPIVVRPIARPRVASNQMPTRRPALRMTAPGMAANWMALSA